MDRGPSVLFRCDGSSEIGLGHVVRCLALAKALRAHHGCHIAFAMQQDTMGFAMVEQQGYPVWGPSKSRETCSYDPWLIDIVDRVKAEVLVLDVRDYLSRKVIQDFRTQGKLVVTIDDPSDRRLDADLAFYPPVPQVQKMNWVGFTGQVYSGWEWVIVRDDFLISPPSMSKRRPVILVTMGGSDPAGMTLKALEALEQLDCDCQVLLILGSACRNISDITNRAKDSSLDIDIRVGVTNMSNLMCQADLALASFGVTAYELTLLGIPAVYLCLTEDHLESAMALCQEGVATCLGINEGVEIANISNEVKQLLANPSRRERMTQRAKRLIDGFGARRIANLMIAELPVRATQRSSQFSCQILS